MMKFIEQRLKDVEAARKLREAEKKAADIVRSNAKNRKSLFGGEEVIKLGTASASKPQERKILGITFRNF